MFGSEFEAEAWIAYRMVLGSLLSWGDIRVPAGCLFSWRDAVQGFAPQHISNTHNIWDAVYAAGGLSGRRGDPVPGGVA